MAASEQRLLLLYPADLDDYLNMARAGPSVSDEQHIYNKLLFDAINEGITDCIVDVSFVTSCIIACYCNSGFNIALPSCLQCPLCGANQ